jgi:hypothetical protein
MTKKLICGDCKTTFEIRTGKRGSSIVEMFLWSTLIIPGFFYGIWRKGSKPQKYCSYCGSDFLLPDTAQNREMLDKLKIQKQ